MLPPALQRAHNTLHSKSNPRPLLQLPDQLTSDTKHEIIIFVEPVVVSPAVPALFSPSFRIQTSVHPYR